MEFEGQVGIVTGASSGIGRGVARDLSQAGMKLVLTARRRERLEELADELPGETEIVPADITDAATPERLIETALSRFGRLDFVLSGAGTMHAGEVGALDLDKACEMVRINFEAAVRLSYRVLEHFRSVDAGTLINVSSILGTKVRPTTGVYAGTKYGVEALSEALRMEVAGSGIRVSVLEPGVVKTELQDHFETHPMEVLGITEPLLPEDVARGVRFILAQPPHVRIPVLMMLPGQQAM